MSLKHLMHWSMRRVPHSHHWEFLADSYSCRQVQTCTRCGRVSGEVQDQHLFVWKYLSSESCNQQRFCIRCRERDRGRMKTIHLYSVPDAQGIRRCTRCGQTTVHRALSRGISGMDQSDRAAGDEYGKPAPAFDEVNGAGSGPESGGIMREGGGI